MTPLQNPTKSHSSPSKSHSTLLKNHMISAQNQIKSYGKLSFLRMSSHLNTSKNPMTIQLTYPLPPLSSLPKAMQRGRDNDGPLQFADGRENRLHLHGAHGDIFGGECHGIFQIQKGLICFINHTIVKYPQVYETIVSNCDNYDNYLVGGCNPSEKYEFVSWNYYSQYMEK